jgi:hypothetical protein
VEERLLALAAGELLLCHMGIVTTAVLSLVLATTMDSAAVMELIVMLTKPFD